MRLMKDARSMTKRGKQNESAQRKVDTLKNAEKGTFEVHKLELITQHLVFIEGEILAHPKFSGKCTIV